MSSLDTIAPASPPAYLQLLLLPILAYANNETGNADYNYPYLWAPHQLGTYPNANVVPSQQHNMPMENTSELFILLSALSRILGRTSTELWYPKYWPLFQSWADYLVTTLPDPGNQTSTNDFLPSTPHNANLALLGTVGLGAFAQLCSVVGKGEDRTYYNDMAESFAQQWMKLAQDGDHYKLAYDQNNTWSIKYNLFYDKLLGLGSFPADVTTNEVAYYMNTLEIYGIPLDNRVLYTKFNWMAYVAAMTNDTVLQKDMFSILFNFADVTMPFTPLTDLYDTWSAQQDQRQNFTDRACVGAIYSLMIV